MLIKNFKNKWTIIRFINDLKKFKKYVTIPIVLITIISSITMASGSFTSFYAKWALESIMTDASIKQLYVLSIGIICVYITTSLVKILEKYLIVKSKNQFNYAMKKDFFNKIQCSTYLLNCGNDTTDIYYRMTSDLNILSSYYFKMIVDVPVYMISIIYFITVMFIWSPYLTIYILIISALQMFAAYAIKKPIRINREKQITHETEFVKEIGRHFNSIEIVKLFGLETLKLDKVQKYINRIIKINIKSSFVISILQFITGIIGQIGIVGMLIIAGYQVFNGTITAGTFFAFYIISGLLGQPLNSIVEIIFSFEESRVSYKRYQEFCSEYDYYNYSGKEIVSFNNGIKVTNLSYSYPNGSRIFNKLSLNLQQGKLIGITGESGEGKSTFAKLLLRLYKTTSGSITIDGTDIKEICNDLYRECVAYFTQTPYILDGTIRENILANKSVIDESYLQELIMRTGTYKIFDRHQKGLDTIIGKDGINLSLGEAQRISLLRTLIKKPKIVVLDEPTSALNKEFENLLIPLFKDYSLKFNALVIIITHNNTILEKVDQLLVLENGNFKETNKI